MEKFQSPTPDHEWTSRLIALVKDRPALYDRDHPHYLDRVVKTKIWNEVCERLVANWDLLSTTSRILKSKEIQQKWQNVRTCFKRELNEQKKEILGFPVKKKRKYVYFDDLLFLLPASKERVTGLSSLPARSVTYEEGHGVQIKNEEIFLMMEDEEDEEETNSCSEEKLMSPRPLANSHEPTTPDPVTPPTETCTSWTSDPFDEDRMFLLSLVPSFKRLTYQQKMEVKIQFLNALKNVDDCNS